MALEDKIDKLTEVLIKVNETWAGLAAKLDAIGGDGKPSTSRRGPGRPPKNAPADSADEPEVEHQAEPEPEKPVYTAEQVKATGVALRDQQGVIKARAMVKEFGGAEALADIPEANYAAFIEACNASMAEHKAAQDEEL